MLARITPIGGDLYHVHIMDSSGRPDQGLPGQGGRPGHLPAWPERPVDPGFGQGRPGMRPDHGLPGIPDHELPDTPPPTLAPGFTLVLIRGPQGKWVYAAIAPGSPPPRPLPPSEQPRPDQGLPGHPDQGLPGQPVQPDQGLPGGGFPPHVGGGPAPQPPHRPDQGLPPTAQPRGR